tara:strand:+ start:3034 stop:3678 length:645 start_codon:yes stop_codon:yes gene_type:complete
MTEKLYEKTAYDEDIWADVSKRNIGSSGLTTVSAQEIYKQMAIDYLSPSSKRKNQYVAIIRAMIGYEDNKVSCPDPTSNFKKLINLKNAFSAEVDYITMLSNTDPFYSPLEDSQRLLNAGAIKDFEKKKILLLETPLFYSPSVDTLGINAWISSLMRMDITNVKKPREFQLGEVIYITFTNPQNFAGARFVDFPVEGKTVMAGFGLSHLQDERE